MKITSQAIERAIHASEKNGDTRHEHPDCVRIAYEWLDAQTPIKNARSRAIPLKHIIEAWGGRYVSQSDVEVAVSLHPNYWGKYPYYNFSTKLVEPSVTRLESIGEAFTQMEMYCRKHDDTEYYRSE